VFTKVKTRMVTSDSRTKSFYSFRKVCISEASVVSPS